MSLFDNVFRPPQRRHLVMLTGALTLLPVLSG